MRGQAALQRARISFSRRFLPPAGKHTVRMSPSIITVDASGTRSFPSLWMSATDTFPESFPAARPLMPEPLLTARKNYCNQKATEFNTRDADLKAQWQKLSERIRQLDLQIREPGTRNPK